MVLDVPDEVTAAEPPGDPKRGPGSAADLLLKRGLDLLELPLCSVKQRGLADRLRAATVLAHGTAAVVQLPGERVKADVGVAPYFSYFGYQQVSSLGQDFGRSSAP